MLLACVWSTFSTLIHSALHSSNVLLDGALTPKLAHPASQLCPVHKKSSYTLVKTRLFQASAAYLPEDSIRVGLPTKRVDIFSCGIVSMFCLAFEHVSKLGLEHASVSLWATVFCLSSGTSF